MVRGSGHDPVTSESKRFLYNGTIEQWDACKMHIRSILHQKGLWRVTKEGPKNGTPTNDDQPIDAGEYYYALQDNVTQGPVDAQRVLQILKCFQEIGNLTPDTIMIFHKTRTNDQWEKWSEELHNKIALPIALAERLRSRLSVSTAASQSTIRLPSATPATGGAGSFTARSLDFGSPAGASTATGISARDREIGQQREPTEEADNAAFHVIVQYIDAQSTTGMMLLLDIETRWLELRRLPPIMGFVGSGPGLVIILA